jgi:hypothetical protein
MRSVFLAFILCFSTLVFSQEPGKLNGTWKVVEMFDEDLYFNLEKDSVGFTSATPSEEAKHKMSEQHLSKIRKFNFIFKNNGSFFKEINGTTVSKGTYTIDAAGGQITTVVINDKGKEETEKIAFEFHDQLLWLTVPQKNNKLKFVLRK